MFDILFGWRKASKCKKLIKRVQCRLKLLKNKRSSIVRQLRDDVAQLLKNGHDQIAFNRVEQLFKDESILTVYDVLDHFCEFIIIHLSYIRRRKDCPNDINEAVSSLIFASARCGDLPELQVIRKLFGERYGQKFATAAVELFPGNLVNCQIKEKLSIKSVPDDVKYRLMDEIAWDSSLQQGPLALEYSSELKRQQVNENNEIQVLDRDVQTNYSRTRATQISNVKEMEGKAAYVDSSSDSKTFLTMPCHSQSDITSTSTSSSIVTQSSSIVAESPMDMEVEKADNYAQLGSPYEFTIFDLGTMESRCAGRINTATFEPKGERMAAAYSSESSSQFLEETIVYLDDVEEFQSPMTKFGNCQDQRLFMFKPSVLHKREKCEKGRNEGYIDQNESWNEKAGSRSSRKSRKTAGKRSRKRSVSRENQSMKDVEFVIYYGESCENFPNHNHRSCHQRKHQKKVPIGEIQQSYHVQKRLKQPCCVELGSNFRSSNCRYDQTRSCCSCRFNCGMVTDCSLEHPCYFCTSDDKDDRESPPWKQKRRITNLVASQTHDLEREKLQDFCHCQLFRYGEEMEWASLPQKPTRNCGNGAMMYDTLTCPDLWPNKQSKKVEGDAEGSDYPGSRASSNGSCSQVTSPWTRKEIKAPYLRSMTMPLEQPQDSHTDNILRSTSFPLQRPNHFNSGSSSSSRHVHPKLPDYDELTAKFTALKKAHLQNKHHPSNQQLSGA